MSETTSSDLHTGLRKRYGRKLRRGQAVRLVVDLGATEHVFRLLVASGRITKQTLTGARAHYDREQILRVIS